MTPAQIDQTKQAAVRHERADQLAEAEMLYRQLAAALQDLGRLEDAAEALHKALELRTRMAADHLNAGNAMRADGKLDDAIAAYRQAVRLCPDNGDALSALANALAQQGAVIEAADVYRRALKLVPGNANLLNNLGNILSVLGKSGEAITLYRQAIAADPSMVVSLSNLANALRERGELDEAVVLFRRAIELQPDFAAAFNNLGNTLKDLGQIDEGIAAMRTSVALAPDSLAMHSNLVYATCFHPNFDPRRQWKEARDWAERHERPLERARMPHRNGPSPERKLRIGYVSPDFRNHVVGRNVLPVIECHDREKIDVHCFMTAPGGDELTAKFQSASDRWHDASALGDAELAELVREQQIDILVDLTLHMAGNRLGVFARKPAPVQVTWAGYPGTTGLCSIDYRITDPYLDPPGQGDEFYSEKSVRLPHSFWCYRPPTGAPEVNTLPAAANGFVTFGCLNNFAKVSSAALDLWAEVMHGVPYSKLRILVPQGETVARTQRDFAEKGVAPERLIILVRAAPVDYMTLYHEIDICLDPIPYGGHTTNLDALWMGVPFVTMRGSSAVARAGVTLLSNLQMTELIATDARRYVHIASRLAEDLGLLAKMRSELRDRMQASPLCDARQFTTGLETAYHRMWREWRERPQ